MNKNRNRSAYSFANLNFLGKCNVDCFFCLGKDIESILSKQNQMEIYFKHWKNYDTFLERCKLYGIRKIYLTGQNTDPLIYKYLDELVDDLKSKEFLVGIRTNGYLAENKIKSIQNMNDEIGYSIQSLDTSNNNKIMKRNTIPNWDYIIPNSGNNVRISMVINRFNFNEFIDIVNYVSKFDNVKYLQIRRISTDTREELLEYDINFFEMVYEFAKNTFEKVSSYEGADVFNGTNNLKISFWKTIETNANSINYFTDGTLSEEYFVIEGYLKEYNKEVK